MQAVGQIVFRHLALATGIKVPERLLSPNSEAVGAVGIGKVLKQT